MLSMAISDPEKTYLAALVIAAKRSFRLYTILLRHFSRARRASHPAPSIALVDLEE
jgi:hypothetical protein